MRRGKPFDSRLCVKHWGQNGHLDFIGRVLKVSWVLTLMGNKVRHSVEFEYLKCNMQMEV